MKAGLSQFELAELIEIDARELQRIERGRVRFSVTVLWALAVALGVTPSRFFRAATLEPAKRGRPKKAR